MSELVSKVEDNKQAIEQVAMSVPEVSWMTARLLVHIDKSITDMTEIVHKASLGKVATQQFSRHFNVTSIAEGKDDDSILFKAERLEDNFNHFRFSLRTISKDTFKLPIERNFKVGNISHTYNHEAEFSNRRVVAIDPPIIEPLIHDDSFLNQMSMVRIIKNLRNIINTTSMENQDRSSDYFSEQLMV